MFCLCCCLILGVSVADPCSGFVVACFWERVFADPGSGYVVA